MAINNLNSNNSLARSSESRLQKYIDNPVVKTLGEIVKLEQSVKTVWSNECVKSAILGAEFGVWDEYDQNHGQMDFW